MDYKEIKEPIHRDDLIAVILNGLIAAILGGILAGVVDYLFSLIHIGISFGFLIILYLVIWRIRKSIYNNHILYAILGVVFLTLGFFFSYFSFYSMYYILVLEQPKIYLMLINGKFWLNFLLEPFSQLIAGFTTMSFLYIFFGTINVIIYIWAYFYTFRTIARK